MEEENGRGLGEKILVFFAVLLAVLCGTYAALHFGTSIVPEVLHIEQDFSKGNIANPSYQATLFGRDIHDQIQVTSDVQSDKVGRYYITYDYRLFNLIPIRSQEVAVDIRDTTAPVLTFTKGNICFSKVGEEITLPEYTVHDDYDQNPTVSMEGDYKKDQEGVYSGRVRACDQSANCSTASMTFIVGDVTYEDMEPGRFDLLKHFDKSVILRPAAEMMSEADLKKIFFAGDSNLMNMGIYGSDISESRIISQYTMAPSIFDTTVWYSGSQVNADALTIIRQTEPEILVLDMGRSELDNDGSISTMLISYKKDISDIQAASPNTRIIIASLLPCVEDVEGKASQQELNEANYCIARMCKDLHLEMLYTAEAFMNESGYGNAEFYNEDGYNLKGAYFDLYTDYIKSHLAP